MAKLTTRGSLATIADADLLHVVDVSDPSSDPAGTSKKSTFSVLRTPLLDKATYDPTAIGADAFARGNHTGTQLAATISDFTSASLVALGSNGLENLTSSEVTQLGNIGAETISASQWGFLGAADQGNATTDSPTHVGLTLSGLSDGFVKSSSGVLSGGNSAVDGPGASTDNAVARFDGTTGFLLQNSGITIDDSDNMTIPSDLAVSGQITVGGQVIAVDERISTADNILALNFGEPGVGVTNTYAGIEIDRGSANPFRFQFLETDDTFRVGEFYLDITYNNLLGTFQFNEKITGGTSGAVGYVVSDSGTVLRIKISTGAFQDAEQITGTDSTATADINGVPVTTDDTQAVATRQDSPTGTGVAFWNNSADRFDTSANLTFATDQLTVNGVVISGGTNTFNLTNGSASIDVASGATVNIDANLTVESASAINQDVTTDGTPDWAQATITNGLGSAELITDFIQFSTGGGFGQDFEGGEDAARIYQGEGGGTPSFVNGDLILSPRTTAATNVIIAKSPNHPSNLASQHSAFTQDGSFIVGDAITSSPSTPSIMISGAANARLYFDEQDGALNEKLWDIFAVSGDLQFRTINDANNSASTWMEVARTGTTINSVNFPTPEFLIGTGTAFALRPTIGGATAGMYFNQTGATANNGLWDILVSGEQFRLRAINDANNASSTFMEVNRTGITINEIGFPNGRVEFGTSLGTFAEVSLGGTSGNIDFAVGQDSTHNLIHGWVHNATAGNAIGFLETFGGNNDLRIQGSGGKVIIGVVGNETDKLNVLENAANQPAGILLQSETGQARLLLDAGDASTDRATRIDFKADQVIRWTVINDFDQNGGDEFRILNGAGIKALQFGQTLGNAVMISLQLGIPTGGDKGTGTLNTAGDIFKNNSAYTNPDYAFEHYFTGNVVKFAGNEGAKEYTGLMPLNDLKKHVMENLRLPGITNEGAGIFKRSDFVLEKIEEIILYLFEQDERTKLLEAA